MNDGARQRHIAFYLPQFHPIPENDEWWGRGFTEWANVVRARPRFRGHEQPHLPADLGFYDLRMPEARAAQADLAQSHGIDGFCYYHYWFGDRRLLERPFDEVLASGEPTHPFCLCWANESWTRSWDGRTGSVLMRQDYTTHEREHTTWLMRAFADERYIRVDGKPLFLVYRASDLPDPLRITRMWRDAARAAGLGELLLCRVESFTTERTHPGALGFDAAVEFAPDWQIVSDLALQSAQQPWRRLRRRLSSPSFEAIDYADLLQRMLAKPHPGYLRFPCVAPAWDNSARKANGALVVRGSTPALYGEWLTAAANKADQTPGGESLVFVNAWNEWGEGAHLEPSQQWGRAYLEAHREVRRQGNAPDEARAR